MLRKWKDCGQNFCELNLQGPCLHPTKLIKEPCSVGARIVALAYSFHLLYWWVICAFCHIECCHCGQILHLNDRKNHRVSLPLEVVLTYFNFAKLLDVSRFFVLLFFNS